tara:strand:+ start:463 stop:831 length:369 start_codon:yes stop_codon:yes gene_type:complete
MKRLIILTVALVSISAIAETTVTGNLDNLKGEFSNGSALSFSTTINKSLVVECNEAYGVVGLSDVDYAAYNRITPGITISNAECDKAIAEIKTGKTLSFTFEKDTSSCNFFGCKYNTSLKLD